MSLGQKGNQLCIGGLFGGRWTGNYEARSALAMGDIGNDHQRDSPVIIVCCGGVMIERGVQRVVRYTRLNPVAMDGERALQPDEQCVCAIDGMRPHVPRQFGCGCQTSARRGSIAVIKQLGELTFVEKQLAQSVPDRRFDLPRRNAGDRCCGCAG